MSCVYDTSCATNPLQAYFNSIAEKIKVLAWGRWGQKINLMGRTPSFLKALQKLEQFAQSGHPVLITGESGVGKELFARSLYLLSTQNGRPFIPINCSQFSNEHLLVSELFGHSKGSFTGAVGEHRGVFETANHGDIFLDEVGELSLAAQKMLLRVIDQKEIRPVGSLKSKYIDIVETGFRVSRGRAIKFADIKDKLRKRKPDGHLSPGISGYYQSMVDKGESFWQVVRPAFLNRDLNRAEVKAIIQLGFQKAGGYKGLLKIFNIPQKDYKKFLNFLQAHKLKPR